LRGVIKAVHKNYYSHATRVNVGNNTEFYSYDDDNDDNNNNNNNNNAMSKFIVYVLVNTK
jgi:hypothetical protein